MSLDRPRLRRSARIARALWARDGRWPRLMLVAACAVIVGLYLTNVDMAGQPDAPRGDGAYRPVLARGDGHLMYLMARSTALDGDWQFANDLARFGDPWRQATTSTGRAAIAHPIGPPLVWTPLIWIAQGGAALVDALGASIPLHGYTLWHQRFVFLSSALAGCGAALLGAWLARRLLGGAWTAAYGGAAVLLGTSVTYYATYMPSYAHALDAFACAAFLYVWATTRGRTDTRRWLALGALLGVAGLMRIQELGMGSVVALEVVVASIHARGRALLRWWLGGALAAGVALVVLAPQLLEWHLVFGHALALPQGAYYTRPEAPMIAELLWSPRNGWFTSTPLAYAAVLGLVVAPRRARFVALGLLAAVAVQVYCNAIVLDWWGSAGFGQRRLCNVTCALVVGLACLLWRCAQLAHRLPRAARHAIACAILAPFVAWNLWRVGQLRGGKPAPEGLSPSCCDRVPPALRGPIGAVYAVVGNPLELPASAWFAWRHGVAIQRWDQLVGLYPFVPAIDSLTDDRLWSQRGTLRLGNGGSAPYLVEGWSSSTTPPGERPRRVTTAPTARALIPNLLPYGQRARLWLAAAGAQRATVRWNGAIVAEVALAAAWTPVTFDLPDIALHTNELAIECTLAPWAAAPAPGPAGVAAGVAVGDLELSLLRP